MNAFEMVLKIKDVWPELTMATIQRPGNIWIRDSRYYVPKASEADGLIHWRKPWQFWVKPLYRADKHDCDDYSMRMVYEVQQACNSVYPLSFGVCDVTECQHATGKHSVNILVCDDEIILYDPQTDLRWFAEPSLDKPYFIRI